LGGSLEDSFTVPYGAIPGLPSPRVPGHAGRFVAGHLAGRRILAACGRVHLYEGWNAVETTSHVRLLAACGIRVLLVCNAAGAVNAAFEPGTWMLITDHINLTASSPLTG
ncbi:MAG: purine-nucleoside phosphorylase, partial [Terrimicrobiaceae bacterium]|nr:purine-nucleoside phosphorylase [Terrimicrobiaceae bacterium]